MTQINRTKTFRITLMAHFFILATFHKQMSLVCLFENKMWKKLNFSMQSILRGNCVGIVFFFHISFCD